eukprot:CAMPEP_0195136904 /NCGR_PEP_ID=MMETSP0448-20130528/155052_1 /TAXON_ID=66468 /ORGANISM="Heterocapsa triquestra, Strain CCMP 448" /LENGTH=197 /DNA_ID=CAMNT_0040175111 /DNA_START=23 /DNA_END=616 /DNA_ORIENTATION=+
MSALTPRPADSFRAPAQMARPATVATLSPLPIAATPSASACVPSPRVLPPAIVTAPPMAGTTTPPGAPSTPVFYAMTPGAGTPTAPGAAAGRQSTPVRHRTPMSSPGMPPPVAMAVPIPPGALVAQQRHTMGSVRGMPMPLATAVEQATMAGRMSPREAQLSPREVFTTARPAARPAAGATQFPFTAPGRDDCEYSL